MEYYIAAVCCSQKQFRGYSICPLSPEHTYYYNIHMTRASSFLIIFLFLITALWGCSVTPSESIVAKAITAYFKSAQYEVVDLKIGKIEGMPLSGKTYMGTPGYVVEVISITLEPEADKGADIRKGSRKTFSNARLRVRQDAANKDLWHVSIISGISVT